MPSGTPNKRNKPEDYGVEFLLEEYRNIAATHDRMRDVINHMFYYFLLLTAVPFTVATIVFRDTEFDIQALPLSIGWLFTIISASILFLSLACASARFRQNQYAKTVNRIRAYFADHNTQILPYLLLPTSDELPHTNYLGHVFWYLLSMALIGGIYAALGAFSLFGFCARIGFTSAFIYLVLFVLLLWFIYRIDFIRRAKRTTEGKATETKETSKDGN
jgi:hypothetical protein